MRICAHQVITAGLGLAADGRGGLVTSFVVDGGAAARAGIQEGDQLIAVNGAPLARGATPG